MAYVNLIDLVYPVGAVYISYRSTSPVSLFGGSWTAITGRFPYFNAGTGTGGSNTHTLTVAQMPSHGHYLDGHSFLQRTAWGGGGWFSATFNKKSGNIGLDEALEAKLDGGGQAHNNMPAYQTLYAWRRTA